MGDRSLNTASAADAAAASGSWKLQADTARVTQGLVASHFSHLPAAMALFLTLPDGAGGKWLQALRGTVTISDATGSREDRSAAAIALTCSGLVQMRLADAVLATFSAPFREGMHQLDRRRRLHDDPALGTVVAGGAQWSGNMAGGQPADGQQATPGTVHGVLLLYTLDDAALDTQVSAVEALLTSHQVSICHRRRLSLRTDAQGRSREHFGFADGISQPVPAGEAIIPPSGPDAAAQLQWHGVEAGEILLGHANIHGELAPGPIVAAGSAAAAAGLTSLGAPQGFLNLGLNGSYLVIRELRQDVAGFWQAMTATAEGIAKQSAPGTPRIDAQWLAERVIGRTLDGDVLTPASSALAANQAAPARQAAPMVNNFGYAQTDVQGFGCPLGAHIRRANPRDSLPSRDGANPSLADTPDLLVAANAHRILRRGRKFGTDLPNRAQDDGVERGLLFMCLNSDLVRHFEFVQQTWLLNPSFATLFDETDPLLGPALPDQPRRMTIPACPIRWRPEVRTYVQMMGGEYFFLPSLPALDYLGSLQ